MRKILFVLVAIALMATPAFAWVETANNGPENVTTCFAIGTEAMTSGNVVVLSTTSGTRTVEFPGREVTGSTTNGSAIYGVVIDNNSYSPAQMVQGRYIKVQTYGYCPIIKVASATGTSNGNIAVGDGLSCSTTNFNANLNGATGGRVTGSVVAFQARSNDGATLAGFIKGGL